MHNDAMVEAVDIPILESNEKWSEFTLEDGCVVRAKTTIVSAVRLKDEYDQQGNPVYQFNLGAAFGFAHVPEGLLKK
jgi:hypothetical protein